MQPGVFGELAVQVNAEMHGSAVRADMAVSFLHGNQLWKLQFPTLEAFECVAPAHGRGVLPRMVPCPGWALCRPVWGCGRGLPKLAACAATRDCSSSSTPLMCFAMRCLHCHLPWMLH